MRALRSSLYLSPIDPPMTTVILESDATDTLESARLRHLQPGALVIHEIFETAEDILTATAEAMRRQRANAEQEAHQALLYYWTVQQWRLVTKGGMVLMDKPAPLSREEISVVFDQLAQHPDYGRRTIVTPDRHGVPVMLANGKIQDA